MTRNNGLKSFALVAAVFLLLSWLRLDPGSGDGEGVSTVRPTGPASEVVDSEAEDIALDPTVTEGGGGGGSTSSGGGSTTKTGTAQNVGAYECAPGKNGGATDTGVTASEIKLATTAVLDGPAKTLLEDSPVAMKAVVDKVNRAGGICGRLLKLNVVNDSFRDSDGLRIIKNFISEGYFAMPVVPSAEGLGSAITSGEISKAKIPVVGTDGMRKEQYTDPYVWPVASATVTAMRVMAKYGYEKRDAKRFAIVWDNKYKFGLEGKEAFVAQVKAMGGQMVAGGDLALNPDDPSYSTQANAFNGACNNTCDMVAMLLLPETAKKWLQAGAKGGLRYTAGAQTLFTDTFGNDCVKFLGNACQGFAVWTGYNPPIGPLASLPGVAAYVNDLRAVKSTIDVNNQFIEGAYLGMSVFVEALKKVGPNLTRERLKATMDSMTYNSDFASPLTWKPGQHAANVRSQSFSVTTSAGTFRGWSNENTGFLLDPAHGS
jgi:ABC-type branched-subunit amino acid transport system substrate-binding protein